MAEIASYPDAEERIESLFRTNKGVSPTVLKDYARIAYFLRDGGPFTAQLDLVSAELWTEYQHFQIKGGGLRRNRLTDAIRKLATPHGFMFDSSKQYNTDRVVLAGAIAGETYLAWIKAGVFFKDMMDVKHGEHSHTFQWLTIAYAQGHGGGIGLQNSPAFLYRSIYDVVPRNSKIEIIVPGFKLKPKAGDQAGRTGVSLWSWLVDCFPVSMAKGQAIPAQESLFSDSYRSPQRVNRYLIDTTDDNHFLGLYLRYRYKKRNWFRPGEAPTYDNIAGATSKATAHAKHKDNPRWKELPSKMGYTRREGPDVDHKHDKFTKKQKLVTLHNVQGQLTDPDA